MRITNTLGVAWVDDVARLSSRTDTIIYRRRPVRRDSASFTSKPAKSLPPTEMADTPLRKTCFGPRCAVKIFQGMLPHPSRESATLLWRRG
jgi:hypothetical protein